MKRSPSRATGPGGVALIVETSTDNRNRTVSEVRHAFSKNGGNLGTEGSVRFMFTKKGLIAVPKENADEEKLMNLVLENGGDDLNDEGDTWEILTDPAAYHAVLDAIHAAKIETSLAEITMIASTYTKLEGAGGKPDDAPARSTGGPRRRAERLLQLRYGREATGRSGRLTIN